MHDCVACLHQAGSRLHEERRLVPPTVREHQPAPLAASGLQANLVAAEGAGVR
jgi:hypothetical protein